MPHKVVEKNVLDRLDQEIENHLLAIKEANLYREDMEREGFKAFLRNLKSMLISFRAKKDESLLNCSDEGVKFGYYLLGKEKLAQEIIESFEDADKWESYHKKQIDGLEKEREELKKFPTV